MTDLAKKVVLSEHFELMAGMLLTTTRMGKYPVRVISDSAGLFGRNIREDGSFGAESTWTLDISDPATKGCLLHLVRKAWGEPGMCPEYWPASDDDGDEWAISNPPKYVWGGTTEEEALCLALLAAPEKS